MNMNNDVIEKLIAKIRIIIIIIINDNNKNKNKNKNSFQAVQLIVLARYLLGVSFMHHQYQVHYYI